MFVCSFQKKIFSFFYNGFDLRLTLWVRGGSIPLVILAVSLMGSEDVSVFCELWLIHECVSRVKGKCG